MDRHGPGWPPKMERQFPYGNPLGPAGPASDRHGPGTKWGPAPQLALRGVVGFSPPQSPVLPPPVRVPPPADPIVVNAVPFKQATGAVAKRSDGQMSVVSCCKRPRAVRPSSQATPVKSRCSDGIFASRVSMGTYAVRARAWERGAEGKAGVSHSLGSLGGSWGSGSPGFPPSLRGAGGCGMRVCHHHSLARP